MPELRRTVLEAILVVTAGLLIGLSANAMNRDGLALRRDYFRTGKTTASHPALSTVQSTRSQPASQTQPMAAAGDGLSDDVRAKLKHFDLRAIDQKAVESLYHDPAYAQGVYLIIDAREDRAYLEGHIPGAYQLNYYLKERYVDAILPLVPGAEKIVVYCNGGNCEDSVLTAADLRDTYAVDPAKLLVYVGGFTAWKDAGLPIERNARGSGDIVGGKP